MLHRMELRGPYFQSERTCEECAERFWGTEAARFCSKPCRQRAWRANRSNPLADSDLAGVCRDLLGRAQGTGGLPGKILPRLFRAAARELRLRGWDPIELLMSLPDEPASETDRAPGGMSGKPPARRKWLYPPEAELEKLEALIAARLLHGEDVGWHLERREQLVEYLVIRDADSATAKAT